MLDINEIVVGETEVRILSLPDNVDQTIGDVGVVEILESGRFLSIGVDFKEIHYHPSGYDNLWWFNSKHLEIVKSEIKNNDEESFVDYEIGNKFRVVNLDGDLNLEKCGVKVGDIGEITEECDDDIGIIQLFNENWEGEKSYASKKVYFYKSNIEPFLEKTLVEETIVEDSPIQKDFEEITESRWEEIIENIEGGYGLTDEESEIVKSVLKLNKPFNVIPDLVDPVLSREEQTHIDATHIGDTGNAYFYYKSKILKKWFCWDEEDCFWEECEFSYKDCEDLIPVKIGEIE